MKDDETKETDKIDDSKTELSNQVENEERKEASDESETLPQEEMNTEKGKQTMHCMSLEAMFMYNAVCTMVPI